MKCKTVAIATLCLTMLVSIGAFAKSKSTDVQLSQPVQVGETTLQPGTYHVTVTPSASGNSVSFSRNGKPVATVTGQAVPLSKKSSNTSVTLDNSGSVARISQIDFEGQQTAVGFSSAGAATASAGQ